MLRKNAIIILATCLCFTAASAREIKDIIADLDSEDFKTRTAATRELEQKKPTSKQLEKWMATTNSPEVKARLQSLWNKINLFIPYKAGADLPKTAQPQGKEIDGTPLYLVRTTYRGKTYIGKYSQRFSTAYIPVEGKEIEVRSKLEIYKGNNRWINHKKSTQALSLGKTKTGKHIYAVRAKLRGGVHLGTYIQGNKSADIPYGKETVKVANFEILQG